MDGTTGLKFGDADELPGTFGFPVAGDVTTKSSPAFHGLFGRARFPGHGEGQEGPAVFDVGRKATYDTAFVSKTTLPEAGFTLLAGKRHEAISMSADETDATLGVGTESRSSWWLVTGWVGDHYFS